MGLTPSARDIDPFQAARSPQVDMCLPFTTQYLLLTIFKEKVFYPFTDRYNFYISNIYFVISQCFNPLPNEKLSEVTKLKAFADDKLNIVKMVITLFDRVENTVEKGENAGYQHFLLFQQSFPKPSSLGSLKVVTAR